MSGGLGGIESQATARQPTQADAAHRLEPIDIPPPARSGAERIADYLNSRGVAVR